MRTAYAVLGTIIRPRATFENITDNANRYFASSVIILASMCVASPLFGYYRELPTDSPFLSFVEIYATRVAGNVLQSLLFVVAVFWIGKRCGGNSEFKRTFSVLPYCLIPFMVGAAAVPMAAQLSQELLNTTYGDGALGSDPDLSPTFTSDFYSLSTYLIIQNIFVIAFLAWALVLLLKAIKISNGFGTAKSVGILTLGAFAAYGGMIASGILTTLLFHGPI